MGNTDHPNPMERRMAAGEILFREGEEGSTMYVIRQGKVQVSRSAGSEEAVLAELVKGDFLGEMAILNQRPRTATATVIEDALLTELDAATFKSMVQHEAEVAFRMLQRLATRLEQADRQIELLLIQEQNHRVIHFLRVEAERRGVPAPTGVSVSISDEELAENVGLTEDEVALVLDALIGARLVFRGLDDDLVISERGKLQDFLEFVSRRER
jgi:CRP/FNR family cyclic AMP-dependent transcriptional regulator